MNAIRVMQLGSPTALYGAERWILALVRHLDPRAVESVVSVIRDDPSLPGALCGRAAELGFRTRVIEANGKVNWAAVRLLRSCLKDNGIQVLHTHGYKTDVIGLLATRGTGCRLVSTPHGWSTGAGFRLQVYEALDRAIFPFFDAVAPLSDALFDGLKRLPGMRRRLHLIRNGVDIAEIDAITEIAPQIAAWKAQGDFVIGYIGQIIERKGLAVLLQAFSGLATPRKRLVLLGEGPQRAELERMAVDLGIADRVAFLGFRADRIGFLNGFDVFVLPSRLEGIPRCLMEAMAARVPIVATDIPGCSDLVEDGRTGLLFPVDSVRELADRLASCQDGAVRARLRTSARQFVVENYSAETMARQYQELYQRLAGASAPAVSSDR